MSDVAAGYDPSTTQRFVASINENQPPDNVPPPDVIENAKLSHNYFQIEDVLYGSQSYLVIRDSYNSRVVWALPTQPFNPNIITFPSRFMEALFPPFNPDSNVQKWVDEYIGKPNWRQQLIGYIKESFKTWPWYLYNLANMYGIYRGKRVALDDLFSLRRSQYTTYYTSYINKVEPGKRPIVSSDKTIVYQDYEYEMIGFRQYGTYNFPDWYNMGNNYIFNAFLEAIIHNDVSLIPAFKYAAISAAGIAANKVINSFVGSSSAWGYAFSTAINLGVQYLHSKFKLDPLNTHVARFLEILNTEVFKELPRFEYKFSQQLAGTYLYVCNYNALTNPNFNFNNYRFISNLNQLPPQHQQNLLFTVNHCLKSLKLSTISNISQLNNFYTGKCLRNSYSQLVQQLIKIPFRVGNISNVSTNYLFRLHSLTIKETASAIFNCCKKIQGFGLKSFINAVNNYAKKQRQFWNSTKGQTYIKNQRTAATYRRSKFHKALFYAHYAPQKSRQQRLRSYLTSKKRYSRRKHRYLY